MVRAWGRRLHDLPARLAAGAVTLPPVRRWREARYAARLARHVADAKPAARAIARELDRAGVVRRPLAALGLADTDALLAAAGAALDRARPALAARREDFVTLPAAELLRHPEIFRFGLQDALLDIVEAYLGQPAAYDGVAIHYTRADGRETATRAWHRDREDRRMVKLAVYLHPVDEHGGPFELLPIADSIAAAGARAERFLLSRGEQAALAASDPARPAILCTGAAGTAIFADTARFFHRGRPATARDRTAIFFAYFAQRPQHPFFCERSGLSRRQVRALVADMAPRQRTAALWHERLPLAWRLIPPARV